MGQFVFRLPDIGEGVAEAEIVAWHVAAGESVEEDQPLVDVMTDKATVELTAPVRGLVRAIHGEAGEMVAVGSPLVEFETEASAAAAPPAPEAGPSAGAPHPLAAPFVRGRARALGVALEDVRGTGPEGRITAEDLEAHCSAGADRPARSGVSEIKIVGLRRQIADRMREAKRRIPHFGYVEELDVTELEALRERLNAARRADQPKLTVLPFLMRALVQTLPDYPHINARYDDDAGVLRQHAAVHIGIATRTSAGLVVPVVRHAEGRDLRACAEELVRVSAAAREGTATREELAGSTITLTSLGPLGGIASTPIINHPEVAILAPNRIVERPVVRDGEIIVRKMMNLSASFDHRIVDGYDAAAFIQAIKRLIEQPEPLSA